MVLYSVLKVATDIGSIIHFNQREDKSQVWELLKSGV